MPKSAIGSKGCDILISGQSTNDQSTMHVMEIVDSAEQTQVPPFGQLYIARSQINHTAKHTVLPRLEIAFSGHQHV